MRNKYAKRIACFGTAIALIPLLSGVTASDPAATIDCDGYPVHDSEKIRYDLQERLDTSSDSTWQLLYIAFWELPDRTPDSCRVNFCPEGYDTLPAHFYRKWSERLFTDHELYQYTPWDTLHPIVPGQIEVMPGYNMLLARKTTVLALSKECYVEGLNNAIILVPVRKPNPKFNSSKFPDRRFDALGRNSESRSKPMKPGFAPPTFMLR